MITALLISILHVIFVPLLALLPAVSGGGYAMPAGISSSLTTLSGILGSWSAVFPPLVDFLIAVSFILIFEGGTFVFTSVWRIVKLVRGSG